jgi:stress response protein SCP2
MSYNGSGTFLINTAGQPVVSGTVISSTAFNALTADLATGLSTAITKDGQTTVTANIPMGTYKFTGLGAGTAATDSANLSQVQSTVTKLLASVSGADTITAVGSPTLGAYAAGQMFYFVAASANTGAVTINIDSLGAKSITRDGTTALAAGDIQSGEVCVIVYDGTQFQLVNGASQSASIVTENLTVNKATVLNESGGDNDTRIEGDTDANLVFVDASTDRVGVGTSTPDAKFTVSGVGAFGDGAAATPSIANTGDLNTGFWFPADDTIAASTAGSERFRIDASGNAGLGVTPSALDSNYRGLQVGNAAYIISGNNQYASFSVFSSNAFYDTGSTFKYKNTGFATRYQQNDGAHLWYTAPSGTAGNAITFTQAMTLDASGNLGVGTTSPGARLHVEQNTGSAIFRVKRTATDIFDIYQGGGVTYLDSTPAAGVLAFATGGTERARITSGGVLLIGKTTDTITTAGLRLGKDANEIAVDASAVAYFNRLTDDGILVYFGQASTIEGNISVSGTTVSYNGGHLSRYSQTTDNTRIPLLKGTVMSNLDQMAVWEKDGEPLPNEQLNCMKVSDVEGDVNVAGVFVNWDNDDDEFANDMNIAMTGDMIIRIAQGVVVQRGDLLMSAGDGTAKPQGDDIIRSKTVAKVTSNHVTCTYEDGSYCVPCVLMAC